MIDSTIKGTNDSYTLRPKIPDGYTAEQVLASWIENGIQVDIIANPAGFQQMGTALNKKNLIDDATAELYGMSGDAATVNDALVRAIIGNNRALVIVQVLKNDGTPASSGDLIMGLVSTTGQPVYTDARGIATGYTDTETTTISTVGFNDLSAKTVIVETPFSEIIEVELQYNAFNSGRKVFYSSSSTVYNFSQYAKVDVFLGGSGYAATGSLANSLGRMDAGDGGRYRIVRLPGGETNEIKNFVVPAQNTTASTMSATATINDVSTNSNSLVAGYGGTYSNSGGFTPPTSSPILSSREFGINFGGGGAVDFYNHDTIQGGAPNGAGITAYSTVNDGKPPGGGASCWWAGDGGISDGQTSPSYTRTVGTGGAGVIVIKWEAAQ